MYFQNWMNFLLLLAGWLLEPGSPTWLWVLRSSTTLLIHGCFDSENVASDVLLIYCRWHRSRWWFITTSNCLQYDEIGFRIYSTMKAPPGSLQYAPRPSKQPAHHTAHRTSCQEQTGEQKFRQKIWDRKKRNQSQTLRKKRIDYSSGTAASSWRQKGLK